MVDDADEMLRRTRKLSFQPSIWSNYGGGKDDNHDEDNDDGDEDNHDDHDDEYGEQPFFATKH